MSDLNRRQSTDENLSFQGAATHIAEASELLLGVVERITFHSEESGYSVLRVKVRGQIELITVVGVSSSIHTGEDVRCHGTWVQNKDYGKQFKASSIQSIPPTSLEGIEKYLGSGMVKGIGPHFAKKLVALFGKEVFETIETEPKKLLSIEGIGAKRVSKITSAWKDQKAIREIMVFLQSHGVSPSKAVRIYKTYGADAVEQVKSNPYRLAKDIYGIGFKSADFIASRLGIAPNSLIRARAGVGYALMQRVGEGHCAYPEKDLLQEASTLLEIDQDILKNAIEAEVLDKQLVRQVLETATGEEVMCLYPAAIAHFESQVAHRIVELSKNLTEVPWGQIDLDKAVPWVMKEINLELADLQKEAVKTALTSKITVITGGPGTGKSTLTCAILTILKAKSVKMALCSPTGRAAKRLSECTGMEAKTIHRTLGFDPKSPGGFTHGAKNPLPTDLLLIDEASMIDIQLANSLFKALPLHAAIIIIGDVDQLPSVGPGRVLSDLISSQTIPTVKLTQIFRQAATSQIIQAAYQINQGKLPSAKNLSDSDFYFLECDDPDVILEKIIDLVSRRIPAKFKLNPVRDIQVLCPMQRGTLGARNLNVALQKKLNPHPESQVERFGYRFLLGDKVMVLQNDYDKEVFNGDMGFIHSIDLIEQECVILFDGREVVFEFGEMDILQPAYTVTIHKSQGSEYPVVVIPVVTQHYMMLKRNLIYTGVTRGKKLVILIGQKKALAMAVKAVNQKERYTHLSSQIKLLSHRP
jgi:exodeoxyribonuclease V alpha subunit